MGGLIPYARNQKRPHGNKIVRDKRRSIGPQPISLVTKGKMMAVFIPHPWDVYLYVFLVLAAAADKQDIGSGQA